ncbi:unnamed protein product, partial [Lymnaea stagnalis]
FLNVEVTLRQHYPVKHFCADDLRVTKKPSPMVKSSLACGLQACISQKWEKNEHWDITVIVEQVEFHCHRFILSACSTFFDERLRSENIQNSVVLENMSKDSFQAVLSLIYQGHVSLTPENV